MVDVTSRVRTEVGRAVGALAGGLLDAGAIALGGGAWREQGANATGCSDSRVVCGAMWGIRAEFRRRGAPDGVGSLVRDSGGGSRGSCDILRISACSIPLHPAIQPEVPLTLYVGNLPVHTTEAELRGLFSAHGEVVSASVALDGATGCSRGFGYVDMADPAARAAVAALHGRDFEGRELSVAELTPGGPARRRGTGERRSRSGGRRGW